MKLRLLAHIAFLWTVVPGLSLAQPSYPLMDDHCKEYPGLGASSHDLGREVTLFVFQDRDYVWLCYTLPKDSYGTLDLFLNTPALADPLNLHLSAQLGEWRHGHDDEAPDSPTSERWWNNQGWSAAAVRLNGTSETEEGTRLNFIPSPGHEIQLAKSRFGSGLWQMRFEIRAVRGGDGETHTLNWPESEAEEDTVFRLEVQ